MSEGPAIHAPAFHAWGTRRMAALGLAGPWVHVSLGRDALHLRGSEGGALTVPLGRIVGLTAAALTARNTRHTLALALAEPAGRIDLVTAPLAGDRDGYEALVRALAAALFARGLPVTVGTGWFTAVFGLGSLGLVAAGLVAFAIVLAADGEGRWWVPLPGLGIILAVMAVVWRVARREIPRAARTDGDLARAFAWRRP